MWQVCGREMEHAIRMRIFRHCEELMSEVKLGGKHKNAPGAEEALGFVMQPVIH